MQVLTEGGNFRFFLVSDLESNSKSPYFFLHIADLESFTQVLIQIL